MPFSYVLYDRLDLSRTQQGSHEEVTVGAVKLKVMGSWLRFLLPSAWGKCSCCTSAVPHTWAGEPACQRVSSGWWWEQVFRKDSRERDPQVSESSPL